MNNMNNITDTDVITEIAGMSHLTVQKLLFNTYIKHNNKVYKTFHFYNRDDYIVTVFVDMDNTTLNLVGGYGSIMTMPLLGENSMSEIVAHLTN